MTRYVKLSSGGRIVAKLVGRYDVDAQGTRVFVHGHDDNLLSIQTFESADEAAEELRLISEQLDAWEAAEPASKQ